MSENKLIPPQELYDVVSKREFSDETYKILEEIQARILEADRDGFCSTRYPKITPKQTREIIDYFKETKFRVFDDFFGIWIDW